MGFNLSSEGLPEVSWNVNTMFCVLSSLRPSFYFLKNMYLFNGLHQVLVVACEISH